MKRLIYIILLLIVTVSVNGQVNLLSGNLQITGFPSSLPSSKFLVSGNFNDTKGLFYASDITTGMWMWKGNSYYVIDSIYSVAGTAITFRVTDPNATGFISGGSAGIMELSANGIPSLPQTGDSNSSFMTPSDYSALSSFISQLIGTSTGGGSSGGTSVNLYEPSHGYAQGQPIYWDGDSWEIPVNDTLIATYVVVDSVHEDTFTAAASGTFITAIADGFYYQNNGTYSLTADTIQTPLFVVADGKMTINPIVGYDFSEANTWLKTELEAGTPVSIAADTTTFDITGLERARFIASRVGDYTYSSRMYSTNTPNAGMYVTNNRNGTVNRVEVDTMKTRLAAYSTTASTELAFYQDSMTLAMTSDTPQVGQVLGVHSIAYDGITANLKYQDRGWTNYQTIKAILGSDSSFVHDPAVDTTYINGTSRFTNTVTISPLTNSPSYLNMGHSVSSANSINGDVLASINFSGIKSLGASTIARIQATYTGNGTTRYGNLQLGTARANDYNQPQLTLYSGPLSILPSADVNAVGIGHNLTEFGTANQPAKRQLTSIFTLINSDLLPSINTFEVIDASEQRRFVIKSSGKTLIGPDSSFVHDPSADSTYVKGQLRLVNLGENNPDSVQVISIDGKVSSISWQQVTDTTEYRSGLVTSVTSGTTDANGDITVGGPQLGTDQYAVAVTVTGTTLRHVIVHSKTSSDFKVRFFDNTGTVLGAGVSVSCDIIIKKLFEK